MAKKPEVKDLLKTSTFSKLAGSIMSNLSRLYQNTYYTSPDAKTSRDNIRQDIDVALDNIMANNVDNTGEPNISRLYRRLKKTQNSPDTVKAFKDLFDDKQIMSSVLSSYSNNRYLYDYDAEIDTVLKYMPKLREALDTKRDNVLCTDHFSKDFITLVNESDISNDKQFSKRVDEMKKTYKLLEKIEGWYENASTYGEEFVYQVAYNKAFRDIIKDKMSPDNNVANARVNLGECTFITEEGKVKKEEHLPKKFNNISESVRKKFGTLDIELNTSGIIGKAYEEADKLFNARNVMCEQSCLSLHEGAMLITNANSNDKGKPIAYDANSVTTALDKLKNKKATNTIPKDSIDKYLKDIDKDEASADDGFINLNKEKEKSKTKFSVPGCIVKTLDRHNVIPIYIEDICLGFYYFEFPDQRDITLNSGMRLADPMITMQPGNDLNTDTDAGERDKALRYISSKLSGFIDAKFINQNQDLKKELYAILKHNQIYNNPIPNKMRITFLPPEDVEHIYFRKDPKSNRGMSDLHESLLAAKLYSAMYITNSIMSMTRGYDKRVYFVNTGIETNVTEAMLNVVEQIKKSNFGIRQIRNNLNQVLNITGRYNDFIIPKGPNGDAPINMEIVQGQNIEIKTDLMNILEEMAINPTGVPIEMIQTRQNSMDYAVQLTMSNTKFLRICFKRQAKCDEIFSRIITKMYNYTYGQNDVIEFKLPPPSFLGITNTTQFFDNLNNYSMHVANIEWDGDPGDEKGKGEFQRQIMKQAAGTFYNKDLIAKALVKAKQNSQLFPSDDVA